MPKNKRKEFVEERNFIDRLSFTVYTVVKELWNEMFDNSIDTRVRVKGELYSYDYSLEFYFKSVREPKYSNRHKISLSLAYEALMWLFSWSKIPDSAAGYKNLCLLIFASSSLRRCCIFCFDFLPSSLQEFHECLASERERERS